MATIYFVQKIDTPQSVSEHQKQILPKVMSVSLVCSHLFVRGEQRRKISLKDCSRKCTYMYVHEYLVLCRLEYCTAHSTDVSFSCSNPKMARLPFASSSSHPHSHWLATVPVPARVPISLASVLHEIY